mmetsp:Transcript_43660/g.103019  ORF Transcript_43660/g.103019 Transcript_43660/m.103019 type:complete len:253 (+) Transcript_43660:1220-1978(+)
MDAALLHRYSQAHHLHLVSIWMQGVIAHGQLPHVHLMMLGNNLHKLLLANPTGVVNVNLCNESLLQVPTGLVACASEHVVEVDCLNVATADRVVLIKHLAQLVILLCAEALLTAEILHDSPDEIEVQLRVRISIQICNELTHHQSAWEVTQGLEDGKKFLQSLLDSVWGVVELLDQVHFGFSDLSHAHQKLLQVERPAVINIYFSSHGHDFLCVAAVAKPPQCMTQLLGVHVARLILVEAPEKALEALHVIH